METQALLVFALFTAAVTSQAAAQTPLGTNFTYQGQLKAAGPISTADFQFALFDAAILGNQVGETLSRLDVGIVDGLFSVSLDFGAAAFQGDARWLEVSVRSPAGAGGFTTLTPRQPLTATPYAAQTRGLFTDADGRVGIGSIAPAAKLDVKGAGDTSVATGSPITRFTRGDAANFLAIFGDSAGNYIVADDPGANQKDLRIQTRNNKNILLEPNGAGRVSVAGNMELGTSSGDYRHLRIGGGNSDGFLYGSFPALGDGIHMGYNYFADATGANQIIHSDGGTSRISLGHGLIRLATENAFEGSPEDRVVIDGDGRVGIGVTSPQAMLDVEGSVRSTGGFSTNHSFRYVGTLGEYWRMGARSVFPACDNENIEPFLEMKSPYTGDVMVEIYRDCLEAHSIITADEKNFRVPHPADPELDIWYCCPEGPEAAMYIRGTGQLTNGRARIELPDHFRLLASETGMTVHLTPLSIESKGLAVIRKSLDVIEVGELAGGMGSYEFDWRVEAVRKGHENYQVLRPWKRSDEDEVKAWENRLNWIEERRARGNP